jgi:hypothetical protein
MTQHYVLLPDGMPIRTDDPDYWVAQHRATRVSSAKGKATVKAYAAAQLRDLLQPGDRVSYSVVAVSRSGMSRRIKFYICKDGEIRNIGGWIADALGWKATDNEVHVSGCGMDMGFHTIYSVARVIWRETPVEQGPITGRNGDTGHDEDRGYWLRYSQI